MSEAVNFKGVLGYWPYPLLNKLLSRFFPVAPTPITTSVGNSPVGFGPPPTINITESPNINVSPVFGAGMSSFGLGAVPSLPIAAPVSVPVPVPGMTPVTISGGGGPGSGGGGGGLTGGGGGISFPPPPSPSTGTGTPTVTQVGGVKVLSSTSSGVYPGQNVVAAARFVGGRPIPV